MKKKLNVNEMLISIGYRQVNGHRVIGLCITLLVLFMALSGCSSSGEDHIHDEYTCSMHPTIISNKPGTCPVCAMDLVRKSQPGEEVKVTKALEDLIQSPNEKVISNVKTIKGEYKAMDITVPAHGVVTYDSRQIQNISSRVAGRLEKTFLKHAFQPVKKGQKVAEIYSAEMATALREYLYLVNNDAENLAFIEAARYKLVLLGLSETQLNQIGKQNKTPNTISIFSPVDGFLLPADANSRPSIQMNNSNSSAAAMDGMGTGTSLTQSVLDEQTNTSGAGLLREGNYVSSGQTLFQIVNMKALRIELSLPASQHAFKIGDSVTLFLSDKTTIMANVDFIQPFFSDNERFLKVRIYPQNTNGLYVGQLVKATIQSSGKEALWIPRESIYNMGKETIVFLKEGDAFVPKKIVAGMMANGLVEVKEGLVSTDAIALNAQFLVDSESFIKVD